MITLSNGFICFLPAFVCPTVLCLMTTSTLTVSFGSTTPVTGVDVIAPFGAVDFTFSGDDQVGSLLITFEINRSPCRRTG